MNFPHKPPALPPFPGPTPSFAQGAHTKRGAHPFSCELPRTVCAAAFFATRVRPSRSQTTARVPSGLGTRSCLSHPWCRTAQRVSSHLLLQCSSSTKLEGVSHGDSSVEFAKICSEMSMLNRMHAPGLFWPRKLFE